LRGQRSRKPIGFRLWVVHEILNKLAGQISAEEMSRMNYQVKVDKRSASEVAHEYLVNKGLVR